MKISNWDASQTRWAYIREIAEAYPRVFAVGDIHGHLDEVSRLLDFLVDKEGLSAADQLIFIGDYIDRGINSRGVLDRMLEARASWPKTVFLKGNHEDMLLSYLGLGGENGEYYLVNGGANFFKSYGIATFGDLSSVRDQLPESHLKFIRELELGVSLGYFVFVHAGLAPSRPIDRQNVEDVLWIREKFLDSAHDFGRTIVFGHTAFKEVLLDMPYKVGIDTGIAYGNKLSAVELMSGALFQVAQGGATVTRQSLTRRLKHQNHR